MRKEIDTELVEIMKRIRVEPSDYFSTTDAVGCSDGTWRNEQGECITPRGDCCLVLSV